MTPSNVESEGFSVTTRGPGRPRLSSRERDSLQLMARGMTTAEAAAELDVMVATVTKHLMHASGKLGCDDRAAMVHEAYRLLELDPPEQSAEWDEVIITARQHYVLQRLANGQTVMPDEERALMAVLDARSRSHLITRGWQIGRLSSARQETPSPTASQVPRGQEISTRVR
ncbi:response regulator transcription factor [Streptomyces sp. RTd22]|nr:helix-turn-helix transcriptional regulator [Streptomyces sp. RTd22]